MTSCIIIGGGIIGMLTGRALLKRDYTVTLLEKGPFGREASWAGGGILSPLYPWRYPDAVNRLVDFSRRLYPELIAELTHKTGIDPEMITSGLLMLAVDDLDNAELWARTNSINYVVPDAAATHELEPALVEPTTRNIYLPDVAQVRNPRFLKALHSYLRLHGANMLTESEVTEIEVDGGRVSGVRTKDGRRLEADIVVIANGAWSGRLLQQVQVDLQIRPIRGQMLLLQARPGLVSSIIMRDSRYLIPRSDGRIVVGSTVENAGFDKSTTDHAYAELRGFAINLITELANAKVVRHWAGLRPGCGDGVPFIGPHPDIRGLYINAGHFRNGIVMAPASAELLAAIINSEQTALDSRPYCQEHPNLVSA